jgi:hypothetical protein
MEIEKLPSGVLESLAVSLGASRASRSVLLPLGDQFYRQAFDARPWRGCVPEPTRSLWHSQVPFNGHGRLTDSAIPSELRLRS